MSLQKNNRLASLLALVSVVALGGGACTDDKGATTGDGAAGAGGGGAGSGGSDAGGGSGGSGGGSDGGTGDAAPAFPAITCTGVPSKTTPIAPAAGRKVYCAIDLGSNNAKLQVLSMEEGKPLSFKDERQCRTRLGFGAKVFDSATMTRKPLAAADITSLIDVVKELQAICALDKGTLVGAEATQWARDATNMAEVIAMVAAATSPRVMIEVLTPEQEGIYGYVAGTRNAPEKLSLDPGSNSFQIGWWPRGAASARTVSVPFGYVRGAEAFYPAATSDSYEVARAKHAAEVKSRLDQALGALSPASSLAMLKAAVTAGDLKPELFIVGQDGALHLSVRGLLRDPTGKWIDSQAAYETRVAMERPMANATFGDITTVLTVEEVGKYFTDIVKAADFMTLRTDPVRKIYGEKALANTVLLDTLIKELGLTTVVLVPQEMPAGYILTKLR